MAERYSVEYKIVVPADGGSETKYVKRVFDRDQLAELQDVLVHPHLQFVTVRAVKGA